MGINVELQKVTSELISEVYAFCAEVVERFAREVVSTEDDSRGGGAVAMLLPEESQGGKVIGVVSEADQLRFVSNAVNKNNAMHKHGVILSEKAADTTATPPIYGGGISPQDGVYFSFSGFPPAWDQAFCLMVAECFDIITPQRVNSIIEQSSNPLEARVYYQEARFFMVHYILHIG